MANQRVEPANAALVGRADGRAALATPALLVDLDRLERNLALVAGHCQTTGLWLRPHVKGHKCLELARLQLAGGAVGLACTTLAEAELMARSAAPSLLLTSPVVDPAKTARLAKLLQGGPEIVTVADHAAGLELLAEAARAAGRTLAVLVDLDVGQRRTGIPATETARILALAAAIDKAPGLRFAGIQAYYGHLQAIVDFAERAAEAGRQQAVVAAALDALRKAGLPAAIVSGGGTGTLLTDTEGGLFTELQPGSFPFLDRQYGRQSLTPDGRPWLVPALFVRGRVVSAQQPDRVTVDVGMKAVSTDGGPPSLHRPEGLAAEYAFAGDEHGLLLLAPGGGRPAPGSPVELVPAHCDTTVNLHQALHAVRGEALEAVWPIGARGHW